MPYDVRMKIIRPVAAVAAAMLVLGACGSDSDDSSGSWSYTDDLGTEIALDQAPAVEREVGLLHVDHAQPALLGHGPQLGRVAVDELRA